MTSISQNHKNRFFHFSGIARNIAGKCSSQFLLAYLSFSVILGFGLSASVADAQEAVTSTVQKPVAPSVKTQGSYAGTTFVSIESGLERIAKSGEPPRTLVELQALEKQQEKVASKINEVTVNVKQGSAQGSGVIITPDGFVLTAAHVAGKPGKQAQITLSNGRKVMAKTFGTNRDMDAGLLQITEKDGKPWPHASLGSSKELKLGQWLIASGHPGGWMADRPAVIRVGRVLMIRKDTLVTDCALIGGDSGGPLFDLNGRLVGIHSRIGTDTVDNMHVPIDVYRDSWDRMAASQAWGALPGFKPMIGVQGVVGQELTGPAKVAQIIAKGPADRIGIKPGDVILSYDGRSIKTFRELVQAVADSVPGDFVEIKYDRQGTLKRSRLIVGVEE